MAEVSAQKDSKEAKDSVLKKDRLLKLVIAAGIIGVALIFIPSLFTGQKNAATQTAFAAQPCETELTEKYRERLSAELGNMVASIEGAGKTKLMLTLDGTVKNIYASDRDIQHKGSAQSSGGDVLDNEKRSCIVVRTGSGTEQALTVGQTMPAVRGVLIVCEGGGSREVAERIRSAVSAALNISSSRVCVLKMSS